MDLNTAINNFAKSMGICNDDWAPAACPNCGVKSYRDLGERRREYVCLSSFEKGIGEPYLCQNMHNCIGKDQ